MLFRRLDKAAQSVHERVFGQTLELRPRRDAANVNAAPEDDPTRAPAQFVGIVTDAPAESALANLKDATMNRRPGAIGREHTVEIADESIDVRRGDMIVEVDTGKRWLIEAVDKDDMGRRLCRVNAA